MKPIAGKLKSTLVCKHGSFDVPRTEVLKFEVFIRLQFAETQPSLLFQTAPHFLQRLL
jgi:hypothetical protein